MLGVQSRQNVIFVRPSACAAAARPNTIMTAISRETIFFIVIHTPVILINSYLCCSAFARFGSFRSQGIETARSSVTSRISSRLTITTRMITANILSKA